MKIAFRFVSLIVVVKGLSVLRPLGGGNGNRGGVTTRWRKHLEATPSFQEPPNRATQIMQGTGPVSMEVDLNRYNLDSLEEISQQWTAQWKQKVNEKQARVSLSVRNETAFGVDRIAILIPRRPNSGLGIELMELAGGRDDGLGITIVSGIVKGGPAEGLDILPGDCISQITLLRRQNDDAQNLRRMDGEKTTNMAVSEVQESFSVRTECLSYDATVEAVRSLPALDDGKQLVEEMLEIQLKRIRRKPKVQVQLQYPPTQEKEDGDSLIKTVELFAGENLRMGMLIRGVQLNDPLAKRFDTKNGGNCGAGGLCRTCAVSVVAGGDLLNPQRVAEKQMLADNPRWRLACKAIVGYGMKEGEMTIRVNPRQF